MTADVVQTNLKPFDAIDFENYKDGGGSGKSFAPPPEGRYTGRVPIIKDDGTDVFSDTNDFGRTQEGYLKLRLDPITVIDAKDYQIRFTNLSSKKFKNREGSQVLDLLRSCGIAARPQSEAELRSALKMASNRTFQFQLVWEAYNKDAQESYSGMDSGIFKKNEDGTYQPYVTDPYDGTKRWWANGKVRYFVSALNK